MPKKIRQKIGWRNTNSKQKQKGIMGCLWLSGLVIMVNLLMPAMAFVKNVDAAGCSDVKIIFARGSGEERWTDRNFLDFKRAMTDKLALTHLSYSFDDLDYPAISVANPLTLLTTFVTGGEAYEFGDSILSGVKKLVTEVNNPSCPNTKYVLAGYSQGAMLVSKAIQYLEANKIIYAATFGDPKIYLPEGAGMVPAACRGENLSNYRIYVPDCRAYSGMLGSYKPYQPVGYIDKLGTWCNKADFFCSSHLSMRDHTSYVVDGIYEEASKTIFDKIVTAFGIENRYISMHDTAILIDSTGSMGFLIDEYKAEALRLAKKTLDAGGRVALFDYRDVNEDYEPQERCNFETCTLETFQAGLDAIEAIGGGDVPESLLSAGLHVMKKLNWKYGATKSVVVLTDTGYHNPDIDGTTFDDVVNLSKSIDPVNFYFVVPGNVMWDYSSLATATDGKVASTASDLSLLTDSIIARFDSLPRVEGFADDTEVLPEIINADFEKSSENSILVHWNSTGEKVLVALNDYILGVTESDSILIEGIDFEKENIVTLMPLSETRRGIGTELVTTSEGKGAFEITDIPKVPNTGRQ